MELVLMFGMIFILSASAASVPLHFVQARFDNIGLTGAISVATSPDGKHVYVASCDEDAVAIYSRNSVNGMLTPVKIERDGIGGVDGLNGAWSIAVSPDGKHVYVAGRDDNAVAAFSRDNTTGGLSFLEVKKDGIDGVDGINQAVGVGLSPDGDYVYVAGWNDDAVAWFARNSTSGLLTWGGLVKDGIDGVDGLDGVWSVVVSPDGKHLYAAGGSDDAVAVFSRNLSSGALTFVERKKDGEGGVDGLDVPMSVTISPDGSHVYATGRDDDAVAVFSRSATTGLLTFVEFEKDGIGGVSGMAGPQSVVVSFDGSHVYIATQTSVVCFSRAPTTGALTYANKIVYDDPGVTGLLGGHGISASPDNKHVYVAARSSNALVALNRNTTTGALTFIQAQQGIDGLDGAIGVAVSPDGKFVYTTGGLDNAVTTLSRDPLTGALASTGFIARDGDFETDGLDSARSIVISPDGLHAYVAGYNDNAVAAFTRDATHGYLDFIEVEKDGVGGVDGLAGAQSVTISPDGHHIYVASQVDNAVAVFSRSKTTGALTYVENKKDGLGGVDGLDGAYSVAVSPDGKYVYVAGYNDDAIVLFSRDPSTGALTFVNFWKDEVGIVSGLDGANAVTISSDGNHLYVASRIDDAVAYFLRNPSNGQLLFITKYQDTDPGLDGLNGARALSLSPDGSYLYVASQLDDAVAAFRRDAATGLLAYLGMVKDNLGGVDGIDTANGIAISPDGLHVYVTGFDDDAIAVFSRFSIFLPVVKKN